MSLELIEELAAIRERGHGAFWGAAAGDALGWPHEMPRRVRPRTESASGQNLFVSWHRRSGGRFMPHEETINPGEYSDDTQLLLCTARSILKGADWLSHFGYVELPSWSVYQRGAGGATGRAVESWVSGKFPWSRTHDLERRKKYFDAGGNGVAMRIMPHSLCGARDKDFRKTARAILLNGICTHGHPRALLGALLYGYAAWKAFQHFSTLPYGFLIESALAESQNWAVLPVLEGPLKSWGAEGEFLEINYGASWQNTLDELQDLLRKALEGIRAGILVDDHRTMKELGCFDSAIKGAGTVTAVSAIFLASRHAPDPAQGISFAANLEGSDTDTLASMTGALLGITSGIDWLQPFLAKLQDAPYLAKMAEAISTTDTNGDSVINEFKTPSVSPRINVRQFEEQLSRSDPGAQIRLPDGRSATVEDVNFLTTSSATLTARLWRLHITDGQTIYVKKLGRDKKIEGEPLELTAPKVRARKARWTSKIQAVKLLVRSLEQSKSFYGEVLGLKVARETKTLINFGKIISLVPSESPQEILVQSPFNLGLTRAIVCVEVSNIDACYAKLKQSNAIKISEMTPKAGRRMFKCIDPDQNVVEVYEKQSRRSSAT